MSDELVRKACYAWKTSLPAEARYDFDSEGRGYKKDSGHMMRLAFEAGWQAALSQPAEQREQYPVAQVLPGNGFLAEVPDGLPPGTKLYTRPAPDVLATLRAEVVAYADGRTMIPVGGLLALIDKARGNGK